MKVGGCRVCVFVRVCVCGCVVWVGGWVLCVCVGVGVVCVLCVCVCVCVCVVHTIATEFSHCVYVHLPFPLSPAQQVIVTCMRQTADHQERMVEQIRYGAPPSSLHADMVHVITRSSS